MYLLGIYGDGFVLNWKGKEESEAKRPDFQGRLELSSDPVLLVTILKSKI